MHTVPLSYTSPPASLAKLQFPVLRQSVPCSVLEASKNNTGAGTSVKAYLGRYNTSKLDTNPPLGPQWVNVSCGESETDTYIVYGKV